MYPFSKEKLIAIAFKNNNYFKSNSWEFNKISDPKKQKVITLQGGKIKIPIL